MINNRLVNLWRGTDAPPTIYHIWIKENKLWMYDGSKWIVFIDSMSVIDNILELYAGLEKIQSIKLNGKLLIDNPTIDAGDLLVGKDLNYITATQSVLDALELFDKLFKLGYPIKITEQGGTVNIGIGEEKFSISTSGPLSVSASPGNRISLICNALDKIETDDILHWSINDSKISHNESGVTPGTYGLPASGTDANTFQIPKLTVNATGHTTKVETAVITIRDYVKQMLSSVVDEERPILISYDSSKLEKVQPVRMADGITYNEKLKILTVNGGLKSQLIEISGDITVKGIIKGNIEGNVTGTAQPRIHLSEDGTYGIASTKLYGHLKLLDDLDESEPLPSNTNDNLTNSEILPTVLAVAASPKMVWNAILLMKNHVSESIPTIKIDTEDSTALIEGGLTFSNDFKKNQDNKIEFNWLEL